MFYDELFSKQAGSIENIANEMIKYMSLPDKNPSQWEDPNSMTTPKQRRTLYNYKQDMVQVLASKLDRKWHEQLRDKSSRPQFAVHVYCELATRAGSLAN